MHIQQGPKLVDQLPLSKRSLAGRMTQQLPLSVRQARTGAVKRAVGGLGRMFGTSTSRRQSIAPLGMSSQKEGY